MAKVIALATAPAGGPVQKQAEGWPRPRQGALKSGLAARPAKPDGAKSPR